MRRETLRDTVIRYATSKQDRFRAEMGIIRAPDGTVKRSYSAQCRRCNAVVKSNRTVRWVALWLRFHRLWCRGYDFPKQSALEDAASTRVVFTAGCLPFFDKTSLAAAVQAGRQRGYNRQLKDEMVEQLDANGRYPIVWARNHDHIGGEAVERHVRVLIEVQGSGEHHRPDETWAYGWPPPWYLDMSEELFNSLPRAEFPGLRFEDHRAAGGAR